MFLVQMFQSGVSTLDSDKGNTFVQADARSWEKEICLDYGVTEVELPRSLNQEEFLRVSFFTSQNLVLEMALILSSHLPPFGRS